MHDHLRKFLQMNFSLTECSNTWRINADKHKVMEFTRFGKTELFMCESAEISHLSLVEEEKDLGVMLSVLYFIYLLKLTDRTYNEI
ncbi:hypothetical protein BpHYR1_050695 [Brachionus plicatilis]|uniref:Uncharacterized protein n=1 Tax=Brachionus plicatilis TaxID=10195 RepID=A0A3M7P425_BRAPC|nr:hypothetical protein BpHYR1_050695 [Brachionus plicatilis]